MNTQYFYTKSIIRRCVKYFFNNYKIILALKYAYCKLLTRVTKSDLDESITPSFLLSSLYTLQQLDGRLDKTVLTD